MDKHNSGDDTEHQTDHELVNAVACKGDARPEDQWDHGDERVADRGTEQKSVVAVRAAKATCSESLTQRVRRAARRRNAASDEHAPHEERLRVVEKEPPERGNQTSKSDHEQDRPFGGFRGVNIRPSPATHLTEHEHCDWDNDSNDDEEHRLDGVAGRLAHRGHGDQQGHHDERVSEDRDPPSKLSHRHELLIAVIARNRFGELQLIARRIVHAQIPGSPRLYREHLR